MRYVEWKMWGARYRVCGVGEIEACVDRGYEVGRVEDIGYVG